MITFLISLVVLIVGFALYSKLIEKVFRVDDRQTPAVVHAVGVGQDRKASCRERV